MNITVIGGFIQGDILAPPSVKFLFLAVFGKPFVISLTSGDDAPRLENPGFATASRRATIPGKGFLVMFFEEGISDGIC